MKNRDKLNYYNYQIECQVKLSPYEIFNRISRLLEEFSLDNNKNQRFAFSDGIVIEFIKRTKILYICIFNDSQYYKLNRQQEFLVESSNHKNYKKVEA